MLPGTRSGCRFRLALISELFLDSLNVALVLADPLPIGLHTITRHATGRFLFGQIFFRLLEIPLLTCQLLLQDMPSIPIASPLRVFLYPGEA